ncbi:RNA helicase [Malassezia brasiliensis]|uniref:ATP-dependent RNA helicase n=1 Tax=Malassezia brasiliensis TaxID=1821822 RepID=A0AAF0DX14_9BASI|nr:RNA helicase [Malassezia brasiliensis]
MRFCTPGARALGTSACAGAAARRAAPRTPNKHTLERVRPTRAPPALDFAAPDAAHADARTFAAPPLSDGLLAQVRAMLGARARPTVPQAQALTHFFAPQRTPGATLLAAETGSGKTLAYLLPVLQSLHSTRAAREHADVAYAAQHAPRLLPRAVVLAPTHELARQIAEVAKALSHHAAHKLRVDCTSTRLFDARAADALAQLQRDAAHAHDVGAPPPTGAPRSPDVLVTTPKRLRELCAPAHRTPLALDHAAWVVVDEADTLFDDGFRADTTAALDAARGADVVLATATIPKTLAALLAARYPRMTTLASPHLHTLPARLTARFLDPGGSKDMAMLKEILRIFTTPACAGDQILIFRDRRTGVEQLSAFLRARNVDHVALTGDADARARRTDARLAPFLHRPYARDDAPPDAPRILLTTSVLSRGLDFGPRVRHVFVPDAGRAAVQHANDNALELLHRAGRSARAGRAGSVVFFEKHSAPGHTKVLINRRGQKRGVVRGQMDLLVHALRRRKRRTPRRTAHSTP